MYLKPVKTSINFTSYSFAIAEAIFDETIVVINAPFCGKIPFAFFWDNSYSAINNADIFPVKDIYSPVFVSFA